MKLIAALLRDRNPLTNVRKQLSNQRIESLGDIVICLDLDLSRERSAGLLATLITCLVLAATVACSKKEAPPPPPPPEVQVAAVVQKDVPIYLELVGATRAR